MNQLRFLTLLAFILIVAACSATSQPSLKEQTKSQGFPKQNETVLIAWWNVENLFDTFDDPTDDDEFLPSGRRAWTEERLQKKITNLSKVISDLSQSRGKTLPDVMGFCEVEHQALLERLFEDGLKTKNYRYAYFESGDNRGIDVGIAYDASKFTLQSAAKYKVDMGQGERPTRDIIRASLTYKGKTIHYLVNHWPSRLGGQERSEPKRLLAAAALRKVVDSIYASDPKADFVIMGDFNDGPENKSITEVMKASVTHQELASSTGKPEDIPLFNYAKFYPGNGEVKGTIIFSNQWEFIDLCLISKGMTDNYGFYAKEDKLDEPYETRAFNIFQRDYLFEAPDANRRGRLKDLYRTYGSGNKYLGGFADHLPVFIEVYVAP
ncbi:MAG: hypothetical protein SFU91_02570 [Chloroherpetonaceae bacterium]|nr:hypothetical protein [Chloroherpetonaceae bacterium]